MTNLRIGNELWNQVEAPLVVEHRTIPANNRLGVAHT